MAVESIEHYGNNIKYSDHIRVMTLDNTCFPTSIDFDFQILSFKNVLLQIFLLSSFKEYVLIQTKIDEENYLATVRKPISNIGTHETPSP